MKSKTGARLESATHRTELHTKHFYVQDEGQSPYPRGWGCNYKNRLMT